MKQRVLRFDSMRNDHLMLTGFGLKMSSSDFFRLVNGSGRKKIRGYARKKRQFEKRAWRFSMGILLPIMTRIE